MIGGNQASGWQRALEEAQQRRPGEMLAALASVLSADESDALTLAIAARLLVLAGDPVRADEVLRLVDGPESREISIARAYVDASLGRVPEALRTLRRMPADQQSRDVRVSTLAIAAAGQAQDICVETAAELLALPALSPEDRLLVARCLVLVGATTPALAVLSDVVGLLDTQSPEHLEACHLLMACGDLATASASLLSRLTSNPFDRHALELLGTLNLWEGNTSGARHAAHLVLDSDPDAVIARTLLAGAAVLEGRPAEALDLLQRVIATSDSAEARTWRAEALLTLGRLDEVGAEERMGRDRTSPPHTPLALHVVAALADLRNDRTLVADPSLSPTVEAVLGPAAAARFRSLLTELSPPWWRRWVGRRGQRSLEGRKEAAALLESTLAKLGGNRAPDRPTMVVDGQLRALEVPLPVRRRAEAALGAVRAYGPAEARRRLTLLVDAEPRSPVPYFYRAELAMWEGDYSAAQADIDRSFSIRTEPGIERGRWNLVARAALLLLDGEPRQAHQCLTRAQGHFGPTPSVPYVAWMGEILFSLGRMDEARSTLASIGPHGPRIGSWITFGLVCLKQGDQEAARRVVARLLQEAGPLMLNVLEALECLELFDQPSAHHYSPARIEEILIAARSAMRGNRSGSIRTFVDNAHHLRVVPPGGVLTFLPHALEVQALRALLVARTERHVQTGTA